eukprot:superscaffoldBa00000701_g6662
MQVLQSPAELLMPMNDEVKLTFTHKIENYNNILWYQRSKGDTALKLIGYMYYSSPTVEPSFKGHFNVSGNGANTAYLHILSLRHPEHNAEYFGAASQVNGITIHQSLPQIVKESTEVHISCSHDDSDRQVMLWYQQRRDSQSIILIGFGYGSGDQTYEGKFKEQFELRRDSTLKGALIIRRANPSHSAVYFCAANPNITITPPTVEVLEPSEKECENEEKKGKKKKTLVCVATGFYPDHVSVFWKIDGDNVTHGVATDNAAVQYGKYYRITSRLRVPLRKWFTEGMVFKCTVSFFNGSETVHRSGWISGIEGPGASTIRGKYLRITQNAKVTYVVLIFKSVIYGVFVVFLVLWLQGSSGKQNN